MLQYPDAPTDVAEVTDDAWATNPRRASARRATRRTGRVAAALCITTLALGALLPTAQAQTDGDKRKALQDQIGEASASEAAALAELQGIRDRKDAIDAQVADLDAQINAAEAKLAPLAADAERLTAEANAIQQRLALAQGKLDAAQTELDLTAAQLYRSARRGSQYDSVLSSPPDELVQSGQYLDRVGARRQQIVRRVSELRDRIDEQHRLVSSKQERAEALAAQAQTERDQVASLRAQLEPVRAEAAQQQSAEEQALASIQARKGEFEAELAAMQAASDAIAARLRSVGSGPGAAGACEARPVPGASRSGFGPRVHPIYGNVRMHTGVDMAGSSGDPIHACRAGTVVLAGPNGGYGNTVVIDHGGGMATLYAHQSSIAVSVGQTVGAGQTIGYVGSTGASTGPHLHFEVRLSGNPVDPAPYL